MGNHHFSWVYQLEMAIFNSYVKLPEGTNGILARRALEIHRQPWPPCATSPAICPGEAATGPQSDAFHHLLDLLAPLQPSTTINDCNHLILRAGYYRIYGLLPQIITTYYNILQPSKTMSVSPIISPILHFSVLSSSGKPHSASPCVWPAGISRRLWVRLANRHSPLWEMLLIKSKYRLVELVGPCIFLCFWKLYKIVWFAKVKNARS